MSKYGRGNMCVLKLWCWRKKKTMPIIERHSLFNY